MHTDLADVHLGIAACKACPLSATTFPVPGTGNPVARLMFIGMEPGDQEELQGQPFVGPAGKYLATILHMQGRTLGEFYRTNVVRCRPRGENNKGRNADWAEVAACRSWTQAEIEAVDPDVIVLMGFTALPLAFPGLDAGAANGVVRAFELFGRVRLCVGAYHPAAILRQRGLAPKFAAAIRTALSLLGKP